MLEGVARRTLSAAGPRYAPSLDPEAPNLSILPLKRAGDALGNTSGLRERTRALAADLRSAYNRDSSFADSLFERRRVSVSRLVDDLEMLAGADSVAGRRNSVMSLRRHLRIVRERLTTASTAVWSSLRELEAPQSESPTEDEKRARSVERDRAQSRLNAYRRLEDALEEIAGFADQHEGDLLVSRSSVLLLGEWGTGKTHFLCDLALQALADGTPAVVVLANTLRTDIPPLDAIAELTGLAGDGSALLAALDDSARRVGRRALIMIDALNESDREAWRRNLSALVRVIDATENVGLIVSCRTPFDSSLVPDRERKQMVVLRHPGFEEQEFDAQLEFFRYYGLPALHVPLLTSEFSRPLFLRLMCEGIKDLGKRSQKNHLRDLASGQKSMTYVLERFVKEVGAEVEEAHGLSRLTCWRIMKGDPRNGRAGLAGVLASERREWLYKDEVLHGITALTHRSPHEAATIIESMKSVGLLIEHARYQDGAYVDVFMLPYQRFSDHLVARHLLDAHLDASSAARVRRSFYRDRRLGAVFIPDRWGHEFSEPGIASALMIEFPERVRRLSEREGCSKELLWHLPKERRLVRPVVDVFLDGLYWRPSSSCSGGTERIVEFLLGQPEQELRSRTYEVLLGLSMRSDHPLGSDWLQRRLSRLSMAQRDLEWSEFVRTAEHDSNLYRLLAWSEREEHRKVEQQVAVQALKTTAMLLTTTDRMIRDRATRSLVLIGEANPRQMFDEIPALLAFGDPYVTERIVAACYGVCMRVWATEPAKSEFGDALVRLGRVLIDEILRPDARHSTWHALTRGYAVGVLQILRRLRPRALTAADRQLLMPAPGQATSPFRPPSRIRKRDIEDPEHAIHMDFGNYTIGRLVDGRGNYDFKHREYAAVRKQIADRMRRLGYSSERFGDIDRIIVRYLEYRRDGYRVDRYGKKYAWIALFEMYGLRDAEGAFRDEYRHEPRPSDSDLDPSFPVESPEWMPPHQDVFAGSPDDFHAWIEDGGEPDYASILRMDEVDGTSGNWVLLGAAMHEGSGDGREVRGWVTSMFAPPRAISQLREEVAAGRELGDRGFPEMGADYYTYHGEVAWSATYGSDVRTPRGVPKRLNDRAFDYFDTVWRRGIAVEASTRRWSWEDYHSQLNQVGGVVFPAPPVAEALNLCVAGGSSDMLDERGRVATIFRRADGPGFGSHFLYMRMDLVQRYASSRGLTFVQAVVSERNVSYKAMERGLSDSLRELFQSRVNLSAHVVGLD